MSDPVLGGGIAVDPLIGGGVCDPPMGGGVCDPPQSAGAVDRQGPPGPPGPAGADGRDGVDGAAPIEQSYPIAIASGQTVLPISPPPTAINGVALEVNGVSYRPPTLISVSAVAVTWLGAFPLDSTDDVRVTYF